jgi:hypothetical protein
MANRPIFIPHLESPVGVNELMLDFEWYPGMSKSQKQKSIRSLHDAASLKGYSPILEISSKSELELGSQLSAFNLMVTTKVKNITFTVETAFQGSKVFENAGPFKDLIGLDSRAAKKDIRLRESGKLIRFEFFGKDFPLVPRTYFYDWVYINALEQNKKLANQLMNFRGFSDIEFNPSKSINCQAYSAALYLSLVINDKLDDALTSPERFLELTIAQYQRQQRVVLFQENAF